MAGRRESRHSPDGRNDGCHDPVCCVIPPHILENIVLNAPRLRVADFETRRAEALEQLALTQSLTQARLARSEHIGHGVRRLNRIFRIPGRRYIYNVNHGTSLPGALEREDGQAEVADPAVNEAFTNLGAVFDFYQKIFSRNSIDSRGSAMSAFVHYGKRYDNAFWDGREMIFGDGDGLLFKSFAPALDVTAHELTHGVTQYEANFIYWKQSGALNESISDVFGSLVKQYQANETAAQANWLMGEQLFTDRVKSVVPNVPAAVRSLKAPGTAYEDPVLGKDPQPRNMSGYVWTSADNGGVHINSGIPNHAFYLAATSIGGYAWQTAGHIWYRALINREIRREAQFADFAQLTTRVAAGLYGRRSTEYEAVRHAWEQVGVLQASESTQTGARRPQALGVHGRWPGRHAAFGRPQPGEHHPVEVKKSS